MQFGVMTFQTDYAMPPGELAKAIEERGFESLWLAEHSHIPASRLSPFPSGGELPSFYHEGMDPFVALTAAAAATTTLKVATGICLVVQRDPFNLAKQVASLDVVSGGRFLFGIGGGWNREEMEDHGTDFDRRFGLMRERVEAMKEIWTKDRAEYHGKRVDFDPILPGPRPVQKPHPPIHVGGGWPGGARRAIRYGNGWIPIGGRDVDVAEVMPEFRAMAKDAGRDPDSLEVSVFGMSIEQADELPRLAEAGVQRVVLGVPPASADQVLPILDGYAKLQGGVS